MVTHLRQHSNSKRFKAVKLTAPSLWRNAKIGLMGGSFNPAHDGHIHVSEQALKRLGLDYVWWLVTPKNPLKSADDLGDYVERIRNATALIKNPRILVTEIEHQLGTSYSIDIIEALRLHMPTTHFTWIMGADNLENFHRWKDWRKILKILPIAIFDRPKYSISALCSKTATIFRHGRVPAHRAKVLTQKERRGWTFIPIQQHPASATQLRQSQRDQ